MKNVSPERQHASSGNRQQNLHRQASISRYYVSGFPQVKARWMRCEKHWVNDVAATVRPDKTNLDPEKFATGKFSSPKAEPIFGAPNIGALKFELGLL